MDFSHLSLPPQDQQRGGVLPERLLPPHQFVVSCRMEKAKDALATTDRSVAAIANDLGIATAQHFATLFRRETGMSPTAWRKRHR